ncbi:MAG: hypothetical protein L0211_16900 [Planctomycetaceae bacterium]|nr:hypothetical protein [Planctomycetaceae bacterium]
MRLALILLFIWMPAGVVAAEWYGPPPLGPSCEAPRQPTCDVPPRAPEQPPRAPQAPLAVPQGMFVQPPASGAVRGPVEQRGIEGLSITFPELTFQLPCIRLPACFRTRSDARMELSPGVAPYVQSAMVPAPAYAPAMIYAPPAAPPASPKQPTPPSAPTEDYPPRAPGCDAPRSPSCDHAALEERLRVLEATERRLLAHIAEYQQLAHAASDARARMHGATIRDVPAAAGQHLENPNVAPGHSSWNSPQPIRYDGPQPQNAPAPQYSAQPAAYITEPARMPAERHWIREPAVPAARITGFRPIAP